MKNGWDDILRFIFNLVTVLAILGFKTLSRLSANDAGQQQVTDESIRDTLMDLANYAIMTILEMDEEKGMETPDPNAASMAIGACSARSDIRAGLR